MTALPVFDLSAEAPRRNHVPRRFGDAIPRPFLIDRIRQGIAGQIVVLQAPPGFGKTELLAGAFETLREPGDRFGWLTVAPADADPFVFLDGIAASLGLRLARGDEVIAATQRLLERLAHGGERVVLFLDEFQTAGGEPFLSCCSTFFRQLPDNVRVVIGSSSRPEIPLSRFRLRGFLTELLSSELAFTHAEMRRLVGKRLSAADFDAFAELTGGWPALVQLAVPLLSGTQDPRERAEIVTGTHRTFRDFVFEEIVPRIPPDMREALTVCSILADFPLDLASHLAGIAVEQRSVRELEEFAPIIVPVDQRPGWFRLHPVLRATFSLQLQLHPSERVSALHSSAACWFAARNHLEKAVTHASRAGDFALATETIRQAGGVNIFLRAGHTVLERLIDNIPTADIYRSPSLKLIYALVLAKRGRIRAAREIIVDLRESDEIGALDENGSHSELDYEHIEGMVDIYEDCGLDDTQILELERLLRRFGPKDTWDRGWLYNHLCIVHTRRGNLDKARTNALRSLACYREERAAYPQIFMLIHLALVTMLMGRPSAALLLAREAEELAQRTQWSDRSLMAIVHLPLAEALYQQAEVAAAAKMMTEDVPYLARGEGWVDLFVRGFGTLARAQMGLVGIEAAQGVLDRAEEVAIERDLPRLKLAVAILRAELLTRAGLVESAGQLVAAMPDLDDAAAWPTWREWSDATVVAARLLARTGETGAAVRRVEHLVAEATAAEHGWHVLAGTVVAIEAYWAAGRMEDALAALQRSIALARPQDCLQIFLDEGRPLSLAVRGIVRRFGLSAFSPKTAEFVSRIAGAFHQVKAAQPRLGTELLSVREAEVLEFLARDATNKEIARDLGLTEATVKFHLKNLYAKLGVGRRSLAVSVARKVSLLEID
ncbi:LuxR C-terminal-related transcriptional regulator [Kaistia adipata]|uniref:LuxR C-terminal-related transcriptional regulator n=1 Tax=Kaistia adipata TaxID=166954 RepID=UPI00068664E5|nr:LuxR C-terminal-related transcriptional regulator [Kaistia adipata]